MFTRAAKREKEKTGRISILGLTALFALMLIFNTAFCLAEEERQFSTEDPDKALSEAQAIMEATLKESALPEELPVAESANDGYWWIKQDYDTKVSYVKYLIEMFELGDKKLKPEDITERLDIFYNPKDNPLDIKMDISVERAFDTIIRGMRG